MEHKENKSNIKDAADNQSEPKQISKIKDKVEIVKNWLKRFGDKFNQVINPGDYGHVVILIGQRKSGKSETIKTLLSRISGEKFVVKFDENLLPTMISSDDKKDYLKIPNCTLIEDPQQLSQASAGLLILEDFPDLTRDGQRAIYNKIKDSRHKGYQANYIIVAHDFKVLKDTVLDHANCILIYKDAAIKPQQLGSRINGLKNGYAVERAKNDLQDYHYLFISFDDKKWHNPTINSRDVDLLTKAVRGNLKASELSDIYYPKKSANKNSKPKLATKRSEIIQLLQELKSPEEIKSKKETSLDTIYKIKSQEKRKYREQNGWPDDTSDNQYPEWLRDWRSK